jgi:uncharacterized membrane protein YkoI
MPVVRVVFMPPVILVWLLLAIFLALGTVWANSDGRSLSHDEIKQLRENGHIVPLETILSQALGRPHAGRLLEVELEVENGRYVYELVILKEDGTVQEVEYDAGNGAFLRRKSEETD